MKIIPLAFDSMGVRSTATFVETDLKILIDPGVSLGALRYGLPPSEKEIEKLEKLSGVVGNYAKISDILTISHYHYDHYLPQATFYKDKILLMKDPKNNINSFQRQRASEFLDWLKNHPGTKEFADGKSFKFKNTQIDFSPAVPHGAKDSKLGFVLMCSISYGGKKFIHASDVQGPQNEEATLWIIDQNPDTLLLSGFPTLLLGYKASKKNMEKSNQNLIKIITQTKAHTIILDHHLVRDLKYQEKILPISESARKLRKKIVTAAEFLGIDPELLEAKRKELYQTES